MVETAWKARLQWAMLVLGWVTESTTCVSDGSTARTCRPQLWTYQVCHFCQQIFMESALPPLLMCLIVHMSDVSTLLVSANACRSKDILDLLPGNSENSDECLFSWKLFF